MGLESRVPREQDEVDTLAAYPSCEAVPVSGDGDKSVSLKKFASRIRTRLKLLC